MSRSFKKSPVITDKNYKWAKKDANKKMRKNNDIIDGNNYKKHYNSWDICDYKIWVTNKLSEFWQNPKFFRK